MATTKEKRKVNYNLPQYLSARQARARHAQIARNYFSQKPSISNLYRGTTHWLRSIGVGSPEGTYDSYATAPAAGIGNVGATGRVAATTRSVSGGRGWTSTRGWARTNNTWRQAKPTVSRSKPKTNKKTYAAPSAGRPSVPTTTTEGIQNRLRPQSRTVPTLPNTVTNRLQYHNQQMANGNVHLGNGIYGAPARRALPAPKPSNTKKPYTGYEPQTYIQEPPAPEFYFRNGILYRTDFEPYIGENSTGWAGTSKKVGAPFDKVRTSNSRTRSSNIDRTATGSAIGAGFAGGAYLIHKVNNSSNESNSDNSSTRTDKKQQARAESIIKANEARKQKLAAAANARRKVQQESAKEKEKSSAGTTQVVATSSGAPVAPKSPRNSGGRTTGGRTTGGRTATRRRRYLDSTPTVSRNRRQRAVASVAPRMSREEVAYNNLSASERAILENTPLISSNYDATSAARELVDNENYDALRRLRQQYKRGGKVRC